MKLRVKDKQATETEKLNRQEVTRRQEIADAIIRKMSFGTYRVRQNLLTWLKEARKVTGFEVETLKRYGLLTDASINGKLGAEAKALRKANLPIFTGLLQFPADELFRYYQMMSSASIQRRYGVKVSDKEIGVKIQLGKGEARQVEVGSKQQIAGWVRSKANIQQRQQVEPIRRAIAKKARDRKKHRPVVETIRDYVGSIKKFGTYIDEGLRERKKWIDEIERRTGLKQTMHNSSDHA